MKLARQRVRAIRDQRGLLRIFEKGSSLPFVPKRFFLISHVPIGKARAEHAISCNLFLTALTGACRLTVRLAGRDVSMRLSPRTAGVVVPKGTWLQLNRFSSDAIILVCASQVYRRTRYFSKERD
jgi:UDP-2-acetamido-3-amino-2,3-dideoxy-glucuronate N-acetyltransferase